MEDSLITVAQQSGSWFGILEAHFGSLMGLFGVILTIFAMNHHNRKAAAQATEHFEKQLKLRIEELKVEALIKAKDRNMAVSQAILSKSIDAMQKAFQHNMTINRLLNEITMRTFSDEKLKREEEVQPYYDELKAIRTWYDKSCFYLPNSVRDGYVGLLNMIGMFVYDKEKGEVDVHNKDVWFKYLKKSHALETTIKEFMDRYSLID